MNKESSNPQALTKIQKILERAEEKNFEKGDVIFKEGASDPHFYIVMKGEVEVSKQTSEGESKVIAHLHAGEYLGEGVLSGVAMKPASAKALSRTTLLSLSQEKYEELLKEDPRYAVDFLLSVLESANERLRHTNKKLIALFEVSQLMAENQNNLSKLGKALIEKCRDITKSDEGLMYLRNSFSEDKRVIHSTSSSLTPEQFEAFDLSIPQMIETESGQFIAAKIDGLGALIFMRKKERQEYQDEDLRLLALVAEQAAFVIKDAKSRASEKARKMLHQKKYNF